MLGRYLKRQDIPPRTNPLVAIAEVESPVIVVTTVAMATIKQDRAVEDKVLSLELLHQNRPITKRAV